VTETDVRWALASLAQLTPIEVVAITLEIAQQILDIDDSC